jgi:hypothetical protein
VFAGYYRRVMREIAVAVQDRLLTEALGGRAQAMQAYLEAHVPERFAKKMRVDHHVSGSVGLALSESATVRPKWKEIHARVQRALPPPPAALPAGDVVEAEQVVATP